jgi:hypothetical protein
MVALAVLRSGLVLCSVAEAVAVLVIVVPAVPAPTFAVIVTSVEAPAGIDPQRAGDEAPSRGARSLGGGR